MHWYPSAIKSSPTVTAKSGGFVTPLHTMLHKINFQRFISDCYCYCQTSLAMHTQMARRAGLWVINGPLLQQQYSGPVKQPLKPNCCALQKDKSLALRLCAEHESKFHDLSGALGKGPVENPLVVI